MDRTLYNASGCKDKTAHDAICSASKPQTQVFRSDWTRRDNEADMFVKMVKRLAKGFNFKLWIYGSRCRISGTEPWNHQF